MKKLFIIGAMVMGCHNVSVSAPQNPGVMKLTCDSLVECYDRSEVACPGGWWLHESKLEVLQEKKCVEYTISCIKYSGELE
jgi:hypothetical protein